MVKKIFLNEGPWGVPSTSPSIKWFLLSVKQIKLAEEKVCVLGSEPGAEIFPSARFKSGIILVHDTAELQD
jgi:hypothetical protein